MEETPLILIKFPDMKTSRTARSGGGSGIKTDNFSHGQRYTQVNINTDGYNYRGSVSLRNIVTVPEIHSKIEVVEPQKIEESGGLYFEHGYDAHTPKDIVAASGYENVDIDAVAHTLVTQPDFELKMTGHADTSGNAQKNQTLSENRLHTAEVLLMAALQRQGLSEDEAKALYETRVAPHSTIIALGEDDGPVATSDETKHQGNRVVTFDLISETKGDRHITTSMHKGNDMDNHEHVVILNLGDRNKTDHMNFYPEKHENYLRSNQFSIADERTHFVFKIDENRDLDAAHEFTLNYKADDNLVADNTNFVIEHDTPGAVTSAYNFVTNTVDLSINGDVAVKIGIPDNIDPALIRVGQITSEGQVSISPVENFDELQPLSESRTIVGERNILTQAADDVTRISIEAKHIFINNDEDSQARQNAMAEYDMAGKLDEAFAELENAGVDTAPYKELLLNQYQNEGSALYNPDQVVFPFQTFQVLYETEVGAGKLEQHENDKAYNALVKHVDTMADERNIEMNIPSPAAGVSPEGMKF